MKAVLALALVVALAGCGRPSRTEVAESAGARLEAAAGAAGMIPDPAHSSLIGSWALDTDRACVVPGRGTDSKIGVLIDYGDGQGCAGSGTVSRDGEQLDIRLGTCRVRARFDGERISFPADMSAACQRLCAGRASLESFAVERVSGSASEAATLRTPAGRLLCAV